MIATLILVMRAVVLILSVTTCLLNAKGFLRLASGDWPMSAYRSVVFLFAFGGAWINVSVLSGILAPAVKASPYTVTWLFIFAVANGIAIASHRLGRIFDRLYGLLPYLEQASAIADLARVDPVHADDVARQCRMLTAERIVTK